MKKILALLIAMAILLSLTACSHDTDDSESIPPATSSLDDSNAALDVPPADLTTYPLTSDRTYTSLSQELPDHIFTTTGSENGLGGTIYTFTGTVEDYFTTEAGGILFESVVVSTDNGTVMVTNYYKAIYNETLLQYGADLTKANYPFDVNDFVFPDIGETANFITVYVGYSEAEGKPVFALGANSSVFELLDFEDPAKNASTQETEADPTVSTAQIGTKENPYTEGMYKVGSDLPAGEYLFMALSSGSGYVCVSSDSNQDDIIENENFKHSFFATVSDGQYLEASRCAFVFASDYTLTINDDGSFDEGMYRVGIDIPAGEYKLTASDSGYYCIYGNSIVPFDIISNDNFKGSSYVTVKDGQYLMLSRCSAKPA